MKPIHTLRRAAALFAVVLSAGSTEACSLVGLGVGAATPKYQSLPERPADTWMEELHSGDIIRVRRHVVQSYETAGLGTSEWIDGRYEGIRDQKLLILVDGSRELEPAEIPLTDVTDVKVRRGSHWVTGLLVGAVVDAVVVGFVAATTVGHLNVNLGGGNWSGAAP